VVQVECCQFWIVLDFHYEPPVTPSGGRLLQVGANLVAVGNKDSYHRCPIRLEYWSADPPAVAWDDSVEVAVTCSGNVEVWSLHELRQLPPRWWHWSYGDRYWASATRSPHTRCGPVPAGQDGSHVSA
jgi:hypothetical protein